jgi:phosphonate transport system substrate-binding protein
MLSRRHELTLAPLRHLPIGFCLLALVACVRDQAEGTLESSKIPILEMEQVTNTVLGPHDLPPGQKTLTFSSTPYMKKSEIVAAFEPIAKHLSRTLGVPVRFEVAESYKDLIERTALGQFDIVQLSPLSYVLARDEVKDLRLLGSSLSFGTTSYSSFIVVRASASYENLASLRGKRVVFVDERSGSGFLFPYRAFARHGVDPERDLKIRFSGSHDRSIDMLNAGEVEAAAVSSGTLNNARRGEVLGVGDLRILHKAGRIPYDALCVSPRIPESGARKISGAFALLNTRSSVGRDALARAKGLTGWVRTDDSNYDEIREVLKMVRTSRWRNWSASPATPLAKDATKVDGDGSLGR